MLAVPCTALSCWSHGGPHPLRHHGSKGGYLGGHGVRSLGRVWERLSRDGSTHAPKTWKLATTRRKGVPGRRNSSGKAWGIEVLQAVRVAGEYSASGRMRPLGTRPKGLDFVLGLEMCCTLVVSTRALRPIPPGGNPASVAYQQ